MRLFLVFLFMGIWMSVLEDVGIEFNEDNPSLLAIILTLPFMIWIVKEVIRIFSNKRTRTVISDDKE